MGCFWVVGVAGGSRIAAAAAAAGHRETSAVLIRGARKNSPELAIAHSVAYFGSGEK